MDSFHQLPVLVKKSIHRVKGRKRNQKIRNNTGII